MIQWCDMVWNEPMQAVMRGQRIGEYTLPRRSDSPEPTELYSRTGSGENDNIICYGLLRFTLAHVISNWSSASNIYIPSYSLKAEYTRLCIITVVIFSLNYEFIVHGVRVAGVDRKIQCSIHLILTFTFATCTKYDCENQNVSDNEMRWIEYE